MKKEYSKPAMRVVELKHKYSILTGSNLKVNSTKGNVFNEEILSDKDYNGAAY